MKPCPFCKGTKLETQDIGYEFGDNSLKEYHVVCLGCGAYGPSADDKETAAKLWDSRAIVHECCLPDDAKD